MSGGKFAWQKMARKQAADRALRNGSEPYSKKRKGKKVSRKSERPARSPHRVLLFGKYKGWKLSAVPLGYLQWLLNEVRNGPDFMAAVENAIIYQREHNKPAKTSEWLTGSHYTPSQTEEVPFDV
jgi:hypothetical protein